MLRGETMSKKRPPIGRIFCLTVFLVCILNDIGEASIGVQEETRTDITKSVTNRRAKLKLYGDNIAKLQSLREDIFELLATYDRPLDTKKPFTFSYFRKRLKKVTYTRAYIKPTKLVSRTPYIPKRTYPSMIERRKAIYSHFLNTFSFYNDTMKEELMSIKGKIKPKKSQCYVDTYGAFKKKCDYEYFTHGGLGPMKKLLNRICLSEWLTSEQIINVIQECCQNRFKFSILKFDMPT